MKKILSFYPFFLTILLMTPYAINSMKYKHKKIRKSRKAFKASYKNINRHKYQKSKQQKKYQKSKQSARLKALAKQKIKNTLRKKRIRAKKDTEKITYRNSSEVCGLLRMIIFFLLITKNFTLPATTGHTLAFGDRIDCDIIDNSLVTCSRISLENEILKTGSFNLTVPFAGKLATNNKFYFYPETLRKKTIDPWWEFIKNHKVPECSFNQEKSNVSCDFSQSKKINIEELAKTNKQNGQALNQKFYEIAKNRTITLNWFDGYFNFIASSRPMEQEEIKKYFPDYYELCQKGKIRHCPSIHLSRYLVEIMKESIQLSAHGDHTKNAIIIPCSQSNDLELDQSLNLSHELGHQKVLEKKGKFGSRCSSCRPGEIVDTLKKRLDRIVESNEEFKADFWGALQDTLNSGNTKKVFRLAAQWLKQWTANPNSYFFEEAEYPQYFSDCMCESYHPSHKVRAAALAEFATKLKVLWSYLNS